ncbi:MAG: DUF4386 family protein, partial [Actinomycetota bacterium]
ELVPRGLSIVGLIGGPLIIIAGVLVMFDVIEGSGPIQGLMTIPEAFWELSLGFYLAFKGFKSDSPVLAGVGSPTTATV